MHCAPPRVEGDSDARTANLLAALEKARILPARVGYVSTSGVPGGLGVALRYPTVYEGLGHERAVGVD